MMHSHRISRLTPDVIEIQFKDYLHQRPRQNALLKSEIDRHPRSVDRDQSSGSNNKSIEVVAASMANHIYHRYIAYERILDSGNGTYKI